MRKLGPLFLGLFAACNTAPLPVTVGPPDALPDAAVPDAAPPGGDLAVSYETVRYGFVEPLPHAVRLHGRLTNAFALSIPVPITVTALGFLANEPSAGEVRLALYRDEGNLPGARVVDAAARPVPAPGAVEVPVPETALAPGSYFLALRPSEDLALLASPGGDPNPQGYCFRKLDIGDDPWPASFGPSTCGTEQSRFNVYLVGRAVSGGDLGSAAPVDLGGGGGVQVTYGAAQALPGTETLPSGSPIAVPLTLPAATTLDGFGALVRTEVPSYGFALYRDDAGRPGARVYATAGRHLALEGVNQLDVFDRPLDAGAYWLAFVGFAPTVSLGSGGSDIVRCLRDAPLDPVGVWPLRFGSATCAAGAPLNLYLLARD